ncbi:MAG: hypothetical protein PF508_10605 [Spirochaeta sp.]|nr:hypothetical protein [Spirochaeta sp.]
MARVHVKVDKFTGYGTHVHVTVTVEHSERVMKFRKRETAVRWVRHVLETEFDSDHDEIVWDDTPTQKWFYGEGD